MTALTQTMPVLMQHRPCLGLPCQQGRVYASSSWDCLSLTFKPGGLVFRTYLGKGGVPRLQCWQLCRSLECCGCLLQLLVHTHHFARQGIRNDAPLLHNTAAAAAWAP